jgi:hypothetical protein
MFSNRRRQVLLVLFLTALAFTGYHAIRTVSSAIYWRQHRDETIERWMPIGYVAHSYHVPPWVLEDAIGLPHRPDPRPLGRIAKEQGRSFDDVAAKLKNAIIHVRPPYPPPGPPPKS